MQKLIISTFLVFICSVSNYPQWNNLNPVPDGNDLNSVFFIDDNIGWITGSNGFIIKTTNAGNEWVQQTSSTTAFLKAVKFVNVSVGWIVGDSGTILKSSDGGMNWNPQTSGTLRNLNDVHFYDSSIGWAVGDSGTILKTTNGGINWSLYEAGDTVKLTSLDFIDAFIGWAVGFDGSDGILLKTTDGGYNWLSITDSLLEEYSLYSVEFVDENIGFVGGGIFRGDLLAKTTNGGVSWTQVILPYGNLIEGIHNFGTQDIYFKNQNVGCIVQRIGDETVNIYKTSDGGSTWSKCPGVNSTIDNLVLSSIFITNVGQIWCVGVAGNIMMSEDDGESFFENLLTYRYSDNSYQIINSVFFIDKSNGWAGGYNRAPVTAGEFPLILKTTNGGKFWKRQLPYLNFELPRLGNIIRELFFLSNNLGWAIDLSSLQKTTDGGQTWNTLSGIGSNEDKYQSLYFINEDTGWVVNNINTPGIYKTTDGGYTWNQKNNQSISSVYFVDANNGWAAGPNGIILKSTDGGETWNPKVSGTTINLNKVKFFNSSIGICIGDLGTTLFSTDGGESWISKNSGTTENLSSVFITSLNSIWAAGNNGKIISTTDFGNTWIAFNDVTTDSIISIGFFNQYSGWIAGESIYKYFDESLYIPPPVWSNQIIIKDNSSNESTGILTFGQHSYATDSIDIALNEYELPPSPPTSIFDARFNLPVNPLVNSLTDFRDSTHTEVTWTMSFQPGSSGYPITFSWDSASFPQGTFYLKDLIDGSFVFVNMKNQSSYILNDQNITSLNISFKGNCSLVSVNDGWNIISVPNNAENMNAINLFPTASSSAFFYENGYVAEDTLVAGIGYWLKFDADEVIQVCGSIVGDSVVVKEGWNLFGVYDNNISIADLTTTPPGIIATYFFGFEQGYYITDTLRTGKGYWVRVTEDGVLDLDNTQSPKSSNDRYLAKDESGWGKLIFTDYDGNKIILFATEKNIDTRLYELPPLPPAGIFDVRFNTGFLVENLSNGKSIQISSLSYPIKIKSEGMNISLSDRINGEIFSAQLKDGEEIILSNSNISSLLVKGTTQNELPLSYELFQNYPNPFNPSTTIKFGISEESNVNLSIYNVLGELVSVLVNEEMKPGYYEYDLNASNLASGVYMYRIQAGNPSTGSGQQFVETKKLILMK